MSTIDAITGTNSMYSATTVANKTNTSTSSTSSTNNETFVSKASNAISSGDVNALVQALKTARSSESSVYGATGTLRQASTQTGWDILMGTESSSDSSADDAVFKSLTPDVVKAQANPTVASSIGNLVNTSA